MDQEQKRKASPLVLVLVIIIVVLVAAGAVLLLGKFGEQEPEAETLGDNQTPLIGYQEGLTVVDDPDALQSAVKQMQEDAADPGIPLNYNNVATSEDGKTFECYIANPADDRYDMYIQIFSDPEFKNQLYLSGLIPPGNAMTSLTTEKALPAGSNTVYVAFSQVEEDHATIHGQIIVTMEFVVAE
jgi:hypothetical protein